MTGYAYAACGLILAACAAYAADVWRCRRREERAFAEAVIAWSDREAAQ